MRCHVTSADYARIENGLPTLLRLAEIQNRAVSLYDVFQKRFLVKVDRHLELLGYAPGEVPDLNVDRYHRMIPDADRAFVYDSEIRMHRYLNGPRVLDKRDYKLAYDYRVRGKGGQLVRFLHQLMVYEVDESRVPWLFLVVSDVLSSYPEEQEPRRFLINRKSLKVHSLDGGEERRLLTNRETVVAGLLGEGLDSRQIAERLGVSVSTINNHRQHLLEKLGVRNTVQAVTLLKCLGLLP